MANFRPEKQHLDMKRFLLTAAAVMAAILCVSCSDDDGVRSGTVDINIRSVSSKAYAARDSVLLTPKEIVKQCRSLETIFPDGSRGTRGWADRQRDTVNNKLKMYASDIIDEETGELRTDKYAFLTVEKAWLVDYNFTVIAYIPSAFLDSARVQITEAYDRGDLDKVYELFQQVYTAVPITQAEYDALKAAGKD